MTKPSSTRAASFVLLFLTLLNVLNFVDRQLIVNLAPMLTKDLGLKLTDVALLYGYIFLVFYTIMGLLMATLADRFRREQLIAGGLGIWSTLTAASGAAVTFLHLALARMLVGIGEATLTPAALSILSDSFPASRRAFANGVYYSGVSLGSGLSLIIVGWMAPTYGWRGCFYALGALGLVLTPLVLLMKTPQRGAMEENAAVPAPAQSTQEIYHTLFAALRRTPALWLTIAAAVLLNFSTSAGSLTFTWLVRERGMEFSRTGITNGIIVAVAGLLGASFAGAGSDWCQRRWSGGRLWFLFYKAFFIAPFAVGLYTLPIDAPYNLFYVCWSVATFSSLCWYGPIFASVQDLAPVRIRATAVAFLLLIINILGTGLGPLVAGKIGDAVTLWRGLAICACVGYFAMIPLFFAASRFQKDLDRVRAAEGALASASTAA